MDGIINWIFFESIYGVFIITGIFFGITFILKKLIPNLPDLTPIGGLIFFVLLFTMQTYPRYKFHKKALETFEKLPPYVRVIDKSYAGDILEPLTWFKSFTGSFLLVSPSTQITLPPNTFQSVLAWYEDGKENQRIVIHEPNCTTKEITESQPDEEGVYRYTVWDKKMTDSDVKIFCETDWSEEKEILRKTILDSFDKKPQPDIPIKELGEEQ